MNKKGFIFGAMIEILSYFLIVLILVISVSFFKGNAAQVEQVYQVRDDSYNSNLINGYLSSRVMFNGLEVEVSDVISLLEPISFIDYFKYVFGFYNDKIGLLRNSEIKYFVRPDSIDAYAINVVSKGNFYYSNSLLEDETIVDTISFPNKDGVVSVVLVKGKVKNSVLDVVRGERDAYLKKTDYKAYLLTKNSEKMPTFNQLMELFSKVSLNPNINSEEYKLLFSWTLLDYSFIVDELPQDYLNVIISLNNEFGIGIKIDSNDPKMKDYIREILKPVPIIFPQGGTFGGTGGNLFEVDDLLALKASSIKVYERYMAGIGVGVNAHIAIYCDYTGQKGGKCPNE